MSPNDTSSTYPGQSSVGADWRLRHNFNKLSGAIEQAPRDHVDAGDNIAERFELWWREEDEKAVTSETETRVPNAAVFCFTKEDHTLGNLLRGKLLENKAVLFAGYKVPHPLFAKFDLRIQTDGTLTPKEALLKACRETVVDLGHMSREFTKEFELNKVRRDGDVMDF